MKQSKALIKLKNLPDNTNEELNKKINIDTNKYKLITCDDPLVINKTDITDIADATVTVDNLTGQYGNLTANEDGTWTYTLNGFMNGLETFTFTVGETTQDLVIVPYREMVYSIFNPAIQTSGTFETVINENHYGKKALYYYSTEEVGNLIINANCTSFYINGYMNSNTGKVIMRLLKNDQSIYTVMANTSLKNNRESYNSTIVKIKKCEYDNYNLKIAIAKGNSIYIDSIIVIDPLGDINNQSILNMYNVHEADQISNGVLFINKSNYIYTPTKIYDPATKVYVDDTITEQITSLQATDEEINDFLAGKLVVNEDNDDLVFLLTLNE